MMRRLLAAFIRLLTGVRPVPVVPHSGGPVVYYANHTSHLDFAVVWAALPHEVRLQTSPAAGEDYWNKNRLRRWVACELFQSVLIPRDGITRENNPIDRIAAVLEQGRSVLIFPEGTRRSDGEVGEFKPGIYHLMKRFPRVPMVPVHLDNLNRIMPKGTLMPVPLIAQVHFRAPIHFHEGEPKPDFLKRARLALLEEAATH